MPNIPTIPGNTQDPITKAKIKQKREIPEGVSRFFIHHRFIQKKSAKPIYEFAAFP